MTVLTINKIVEELKDLPKDKITSLYDYIRFLKNQNNKTSDKKPNKKSKIPNKETLKAIKDVDQGKNLIKCKDVQDMFKKLGI